MVKKSSSSPLALFERSVGNCFKNYFNFKGRTSRDEFLWFAPYLLLVVGVFSTFHYLRWRALNDGSAAAQIERAVRERELAKLFPNYRELEASMTLSDELSRLIIGVVSDPIFLFAFVIPFITVTARRLHDVGLSGWWQLLPIGLIMLGSGVAGDIVGFVVIASFIGLIAMCCQPGQMKSNRFGKPPK